VRSGRRANPLVAPLSPSDARGLSRLRRLHRSDPEEALRKGSRQPRLLGLLHARLAVEAAQEGDVASALACAREAASVPGGAPDAAAAGILAAVSAMPPGSEEAEPLLLEAWSTAAGPLGRGVAMARLALLYRERGIPLGFRFYAPRALRILDRESATGLHPDADRDAARLACAVLEYHHRRDEPERSGRAHAVLERVRDADPATTVQGLKYHGLALGRLQEWEGARRTLLEAASIAEDCDLRGCDGVFVYAAAVMAQEKDFTGARRLLGKVHIRRLEPSEKTLFRQFRHLVTTAQKHRPLKAEEAEKFRRAQRRRELRAQKKVEEKAAATAERAAKSKAGTGKAGTKTKAKTRPGAAKPKVKPKKAKSKKAKAPSRKKSKTARKPGA